MSEKRYCYQCYGLNDRTCYKEKGHKGAHGSGYPKRKNLLFCKPMPFGFVCYTNELGKIAQRPLHREAAK